MIKNHKSFLISSLIVLGALFLGGIIGFFLGGSLKGQGISDSAQPIREKNDKYIFIHPLLALGRPKIDTPSDGYSSLSNSINKYISSQERSGVLNSASVYFIDYDKNGFFSINQNEPYEPASLLKVVLMVAYLKKVDSNSSLLNDEYVYNPTIAQNLEQVRYESKSGLITGESYSVSTLMDKMIIDSDNGAMYLLLSHMDDTYFNNVFASLGLKGPRGISNYTISAADYSLFFRILYNGTYLSDTNSERALSILSRAKFSDGLVAGLPAGVVVAHKFGEYLGSTPDGAISKIELHDCGMIYTQKDPYLLCVMTKGNTLNDLKSTIKTISKMAYDEVSQN